MKDLFSLNRELDKKFRARSEANDYELYVQYEIENEATEKTKLLKVPVDNIEIDKINKRIIFKEKIL